MAAHPLVGHILDMALRDAVQPSPQAVGNAFVVQYYITRLQSPGQVHKFYQHSSILSRPDSNGMMTSVTTMQAIKDKVLSSDVSNRSVNIEHVDSQASYKDGVLLVVTGSLTGRDNISHNFTQSFFLAPQQKGGYVVLNDILRFVDPSQATMNGTNGDDSIAALTTEPESILVQGPHLATSVEHETLHTVENIDNGEEIVKPMENDPSEGSIVVAADPEVHVGQSDDQPVSEAAVSVSQEDVPKRSHASIVKVDKVSQSSVLNTVPVSKPKVTLPRAAPPNLDAVNSEKQPASSSKPSITFEAAVTTGDNVPENNSNDVVGHSIYIKHLPLSPTPEEVETEYKKFGPIKSGGVQVRNHKVECFVLALLSLSIECKRKSRSWKRRGNSVQRLHLSGRSRLQSCVSRLRRLLKRNSVLNLKSLPQSNMALPGAAQTSPQVVGVAFVQQYYFVLHQIPDQVHRFYQDSSILGRPDSNGMMASVTTMQAIKDKVLSVDFCNYSVDIESVDSQASYKGGVLVVVTGSLIGRDNIRRKFTQSFFLAPQKTGGYVVLNDIFRFVDPSQPSETNQAIAYGINGDVSTAALTPKPESTSVQEPHLATLVEHETLHTVDDIDNGEEVVKPMELVPSEGLVVVAADPEVHVDQSDDQPVSEAAVSVSQEDELKKSHLNYE